ERRAPARQGYLARGRLDDDLYGGERARAAGGIDPDGVRADVERLPGDAHEGVASIVLADLSGARPSVARDLCADRAADPAVVEPQPDVTPRGKEEPVSVPPERRDQRGREGRRALLEGDVRGAELCFDRGARPPEERDEPRRAAHAPRREA